jgi:hypothetical protein
MLVSFCRFKIKLVDFGANGSFGGDDVEQNNYSTSKILGFRLIFL